METKARDALIKGALLMDPRGEHEEAMFILRRAAFGRRYRLFSGSTTIGHPVPTDASPALVKAVLRVSALPGLYSSHKSWTFFTAMKLVMPYLGHPDALERAVAVTKSRSCRRIQTCGGHWRSSPIWLGPCYNSRLASKPKRLALLTVVTRRSIFPRSLSLCTVGSIG